MFSQEEQFEKDKKNEFNLNQKYFIATIKLKHNSKTFSTT